MGETIFGASLGPSVVEVVPNDNYELLLTFNNGKEENLMLDSC